MKKNDPISFETLEKILKHYHKAGYTFIQLHRDKDKNNEIKVYFNDLRKNYYIGLHKFNHDIMLLRKAGVLDVKNQTLDFALIKLI